VKDLGPPVEWFDPAPELQHCTGGEGGDWELEEEREADGQLHNVQGLAVDDLCVEDVLAALELISEVEVGAGTKDN
jgi:hypothetical protein